MDTGILNNGSRDEGALFVIRGLLAENLLSTGIDYSIDPCILKVVECGELRIQLSPFRVTGIVVFNTKSDLKKSCSYGKKFFSCMEDAEELCKHRPTVYDRITENREFALSVCDDEGTWRKFHVAVVVQWLKSKSWLEFCEFEPSTAEDQTSRNG
ncbi:hypothetical protein TNCV_1760861 [Trichonephila clavipes]|nr:hypothetical protein TNCV_1760861 [Trichonephila clavipes]